MLGEGAEAAALHLHQGSVLRMVAQGDAARLGIGQQLHRPVHADGEDVVPGLEALREGAHLQIGAEAAEIGRDLLARLGMESNQARHREQRQRPLQRQRVRVHAAGQGGAARLGRLALLVHPGLAELDIEAIGTTAEGDLLLGGRVDAEAAVAALALGRLALRPRNGEGAGVAAFRVVRAADEGAGAAQAQAQPAAGAVFLLAAGATAGVGPVLARGEEMRAEILVQRVDDVADLQLLRRVHRGAELVPELVHHLAPVGPAAGDVVELLLHCGGEAGVHVALEEGDEEGGDEAPAILRHEAPLLQPHIVPVLQGLQDGGIGGGAADAELLHLFHQARLGVAGRGLGEVLARHHLAALRGIALAHRGQRLVLVIGREARVVDILAVELQVAVEGDDLAGGAQPRLAGGIVEVHRRLVHLGRLHLGGDGALPDEVVQAPLVRVEVAGHLLRRAGHVRRADGLMRLLGVLGLGGVFAGGGGQVVRAESGFHMVADAHDGLARHAHAVRPHIGDEADRLAADIHALIELLGQAHGGLGAEAELAGGLLLEGGGGEGRGRVTLGALLLDRGDGEPPALDEGLGVVRRGLVRQVELVELAPLEMGQARGEGGAGGGVEARLDCPVLARLEGLDLGFAVRDQPQRDRLHAPSRAGAGQLAPEHGGEGEADEVVERAARQIGVDQRHIEVARMGDRVLDGPLGDLVEGDPVDLDALQRAAAL